MESTTCLPTPISLSRPRVLRWMDLAADGLRGLQQRWQARRHARQDAEQALIDAELDDYLLRDVGASDWLRATLQARRESEDFLVAELRARMARSW